MNYLVAFLVFSSLLALVTIFLNPEVKRANYILTNYEKDMYDVPASQFLNQSWEDGDKNLLKDLTDSDFEIDVYSDCESMFGSGETAKDYVSNMTVNKQLLDKKEVLRFYCVLFPR